jgi:N,N'-diacetyllegionaminate synthase
MRNSKKIKIIAEAAQGFEGDPLLARLLVRAAARAGADAVKFQLVYADEIATPSYKYYDLFKKLEMPAAGWRQVAGEAKKEGVGLYFDVFGKKSLRMALALGAQGLKIHATDFYHDELIRAALNTGKSILMGLGGLGEKNLSSLFERHPKIKTARVTMMHGFQAEPTPLRANNLLRLGTLAALCHPAGIGFMDHSDGGKEDSLELCLLALPLGVSVVEKHITLDRELQLEDYVSALPPSCFKKFVKKIRKYEKALGSSALEPGSDERMYRSKSAKIVVAARKLKKGSLLRNNDLKLLRVDKQETLPAILDPKEVFGLRVSRDILRHHPIFKRFLYKK